MRMLELFGDNMDARLLNNIILRAAAESYGVRPKRRNKGPGGHSTSYMKKQRYFWTSDKFFILFNGFLFIVLICLLNLLIPTTPYSYLIISIRWWARVWRM
jgi:hypothetical protein